MIKHFVEFFSPGTFVSESTIKEIGSWDVNEAVEMSKIITERHGAKPYGFRFTTKMRTENDLDSKVVNSSNMYFLGGRIYYLEELILLDRPGDKILINNMRLNGYDRVVENTNSYKITLPLEKDDVVL